MSLSVDTSVLPQEYVEDCHVCCQPILVRVDEDGLQSDALSVICLRDD